MLITQNKADRDGADATMRDLELMIALGITGGLFLSVRALRPIRDLIDTVQTVAAGRMDARVPSRQTGDETGGGRRPLLPWPSRSER